MTVPFNGTFCQWELALIPAGLINIICGQNTPAIGKAVREHDAANFIGFTSSAEVVRRLK